MFAKAGCFMGKVTDATIFEDRNRDEAENILLSRGFERYGKEMMMNGYWGEPMECRIFIGPVYYQKLKHMVIDKIHSKYLEIIYFNTFARSF
jgi:DNA-directed RNA polymerase beta subunit